MNIKNRRSLLDEKDKQYIRDHFSFMLVSEMSKEIEKDERAIVIFMGTENLETFVYPRKKSVPKNIFDDSKASYDFLFIGKYHST